MDFCSLMVKAMMMAGKTQAEIALISGLSSAQIGLIAHKQRATVTTDTVEAIVRAMVIVEEEINSGR